MLHQEPPPPKPASSPVTRRKNFVAPVVAVIVLGAVIVGVRSRHTTTTQPAPAAPAGTAEQPPVEQQSPAPSVPSRKPTAYASRSGAVPKSSPRPSVKVVDSAPAAQGIAKQVLPQVPLSARQTIHGKVKVKVRVVVNTTGDVSSATLISPGPSKYFARLALEASRQWKFQPTGVDGQSAPAMWLLQYRFGRSSTEVTPVASH